MRKTSCTESFSFHYICSIMISSWPHTGGWSNYQNFTPISKNSQKFTENNVELHSWRGDDENRVNALVPASVQSESLRRDISPIFSFKRYSALSTSAQAEWFCICIISITVYLICISSITVYLNILFVWFLNVTFKADRIKVFSFDLNLKTIITKWSD